MNYQIQPGYFESAYGAVLKAWERKQAGKPPVRLGDLTPRNFWRDFFASLPTTKTYTYYELAELSGKRFEVLTVNVTEPRSRVEAFLTHMQLDLPVLLDHSGDTARSWRARILPATFIIGLDGTIRYGYAGELDWAEPHIVDMISALTRIR